MWGSGGREPGGRGFMECKLIEVMADRLQGGERERYLPGWHPGFWTLPVPLLKVGREDSLMSGGTHVPREAQDWRGGVPRTPVLVNTLPAVWPWVRLRPSLSLR